MRCLPCRIFQFLPVFIAYVFPASRSLFGRFFLDRWTVHGDMMVVFAVALTLAADNSTRAFRERFAAQLRSGREDRPTQRGQ